MSSSLLDRCKPRLHDKDLVILPLILAALISIACGGVSASATPVQSARTHVNVSPHSAVLTSGGGTLVQSALTELNISPNSAVLTSGSKQQFTATVKNTSNSAVVWKANAGSISSTGLFIAPVVRSQTRVEVRATSVANTSSSAVSILTIEPNEPLHITSNGLPQGVVGVPYAQTLSAFGGVPPYQWSWQGSLPAGLSLGAASGSISGTPTTTGSFPVQVVVADASSNAATQSLTLVTINPGQTLHIITNQMPQGVVGVPYAQTLSAAGGVPPYQWSWQGSLPAGLSLDAASGSISGTPTTTGSFPVQVVVADASSNTATQSLTLVTAKGQVSGNYDGPAELPRVYIQSTLGDTPAPGTVIAVSANGDLQTALNNASCGDTIELQAGATYTGVFTLPAKNCDDSHWIILRTNAPDSALPAEGTRITPCYAGVASLPARPPLQCTSTANVLARLLMSATSAPGPIQFASGANHYRLLGLEITRQQGTPVVYSLASVLPQGTMDHVVFDRVWMHGTAQDETTRGIALGSSTYVSIVDSYFTDFHCTSVSGSCSDAQAISGGLGSFPMGPYKIVNNFLESAGENILFGGGAATLAPTDIEIRHNHMFKPLTWLQGQSGYVGGTNGNPFIVKNLLELKNAQRVLIDSNTMDNSWGGFSQAGFAILVTPKNQAGGGGVNLCPGCQVTDVTIRYLKIRHVGAGMQIANGLSDNGGKALDGERYSIHDVIIDDLDGVKYKGSGEFAQVSTGAGAALLQNVTIDHVTAFPSTTLFFIGGQIASALQMTNFVFTNSIVNAGVYPVWSTGGGATNCAFHDSPLITFNACFSSYALTANAIIAPPSTASAANWPLGNFFPAAATAVQFVNYNSGNGGDYHLLPSSPFKGLGTDRKDLGADVDAVDSATAGVD